jgi:DNA-binding transcriptional LysR family regulator
MALNIRQIEIFHEVAKILHFSGAASKLKIPQPAVSRAIRALEKELGTELFNRHTRSVELTQAGSIFRAQSSIGLAQLDRAVSMARAAADGRAGNLRIAFMEFAAEGTFPRLLKRFTTLYPQVSVDTRSSYTEKILDDVEFGLADVGFVVGPARRDGLASRIIQSDRLVALMHKNHRLARRRILSLRDLENEPFVLGRRETWGPFVVKIEELCQNAGYTPRIVQEADWGDSIFAFVNAEIGITIYVERTFSLNPANIVVKPLDDVTDQVITQMIWKTSNPDPVLARFLDCNA